MSAGREQLRPPHSGRAGLVGAGPRRLEEDVAAHPGHVGPEDSCPDGALTAFNIDAKINGAYIALGLLYGRRDSAGRSRSRRARGRTRTAIRRPRAASSGSCSATADPGRLEERDPRAGRQKFDYTRSSLNDISRSTLERALKLVELAGGTVTDAEVAIPVQAPRPRPSSSGTWACRCRGWRTDDAWRFKGFARVAGSTSRDKACACARAVRGPRRCCVHGRRAGGCGRHDAGGRPRRCLSRRPPAHAIDAYVVGRTHDNDLWHVYGLARARTRSGSSRAETRTPLEGNDARSRRRWSTGRDDVRDRGFRRCTPVTPFGLPAATARGRIVPAGPGAWLRQRRLRVGVQPRDQVKARQKGRAESLLV